MSLLVICEILGHSVNTLTIDEKYSLRNSELLLQPIETIFDSQHAKGFQTLVNSLGKPFYQIFHHSELN